MPLGSIFCPFLSESGLYNRCDRELQDLLVNAVRDAGKHPDRLLKGQKPLEVGVLRGRHGVESDKTAILVDGEFGCDDQGNQWVRIQFLRGGRTIVATVPRTNITGLKCSCRVQTFFERIKAASRSCPAGFKIEPKRKDIYVGRFFGYIQSPRKKMQHSIAGIWVATNRLTSWCPIPTVRDRRKSLPAKGNAIPVILVFPTSHMRKKARICSVVLWSGDHCRDPSMRAG